MLIGYGHCDGAISRRAATYICNGGVTAFGARIVSSFGYTPLQTILLLIPGGAATVVRPQPTQPFFPLLTSHPCRIVFPLIATRKQISLYIFGFLAGRNPNRLTLLIPLSCIPVLVGAIIIWKSSWHHRGWPLFGYYLLPTFGTPYVLMSVIVNSSVR
jgi:hypothetical protein